MGFELAFRIPLKALCGYRMSDAKRIDDIAHGNSSDAYESLPLAYVHSTGWQP
jgi:hypothetical protein